MPAQFKLPLANVVRRSQEVRFVYISYFVYIAALTVVVKGYFSMIDQHLIRGIDDGK